MSEDDIPDIAALLEEIPLLMKARAFAQSLDGAAFFSRLGQPLDRKDRAAARAYLDGLGFPGAEPASLDSFEEAADAGLALDHDPEGWEAEEMLRSGLAAAALELLDPTALDAAVALVAEKAGLVAQEAVAEASAMWDVRDEGLLNAMAGGAVQAAHGAVLAVLAGETEHPFLDRFRLYVRGRWPVGLAGRTLNVF